MKNNSLIQELTAKEIPFAIMISYTTLAAKGSDITTRDYTLICEEKPERTNLKNKRFTRSRYIKCLSEAELRHNEIVEFLQNQHEFENVISNEYGKVYDVKGGSFRRYFLNRSSI